MAVLRKVFIEKGHRISVKLPRRKLMEDCVFTGFSKGGGFHFSRYPDYGGTLYFVTPQECQTFVKENNALTECILAPPTSTQEGNKRMLSTQLTIPLQ